MACSGLLVCVHIFTVPFSFYPARGATIFSSHYVTRCAGIGKGATLQTKQEIRSDTIFWFDAIHNQDHDGNNSDDSTLAQRDPLSFALESLLGQMEVLRSQVYLQTKMSRYSFTTVCGFFPCYRYTCFRTCA